MKFDTNNRSKSVSVLLGLLAFLATAHLPAAQREPPFFLLPKHKLDPAEVALIINDNSPLSIRIGEYYRKRRDIPPRNVIHIRLPARRARLSPDDFRDLEQEISKLSPEIKALALTWMLPYRVGCMSLTSALTLGYSPTFCEKPSCRRDDEFSPLFNQTPGKPADRPYRLTMMLAARNWAKAKALIDRGIASDGTRPPGTAYLVSTPDKNRNVRSLQYDKIVDVMDDYVNTTIVQSDGIRDKSDVLFYFTGITQVPGLETLDFLPGAIADHLTSAGGVLNGNKQMSAVRWLEAGATGSYGTVVEPCNYPQKFPQPGIVMSRYLSGRTLIEAYWQSVAWPKEGVFIGEPLAAPFSGYRAQIQGREILLSTSVLTPGYYRLYGSHSVLGPFGRERFILTVKPGERLFRLPDLNWRVYKLESVSTLFR